MAIQNDFWSLAFLATLSHERIHLSYDDYLVDRVIEEEELI